MSEKPMPMHIAPRVEGSSLAVEVTFDNTLSEPVYLMNWLMDWFGLLGDPAMDALRNKDADPTRALAYVCLGKNGEAVLLNGDGPPAPSNIGMAVPRVPRGTRLLPGEHFENTIRLPLPLLEWYAYKPPSADKTVPTAVSQVRYRLECVRHSACRTRAPKEHPNFKGAWSVLGLPETHEAVANLAAPITLLRRVDEFTRFG